MYAADKEAERKCLRAYMKKICTWLGSGTDRNSTGFLVLIECALETWVPTWPNQTSAENGL